MSLFSPSPACLPAMSGSFTVCTLCVCVFSPSHIVSCVTNVTCILIGSLTWF